MLANDEAVREVVYGDGGVLASLPKGAVHISSSTISVALAEQLAADHDQAGQGFVAAPVFGRPDAAAAAKLFVVAAGRPETIGTVNPVFAAIGQRTFVVAERPEAANLVKLSGNFLIASVIETLGEAMLSRAHGDEKLPPQVKNTVTVCNANRLTRRTGAVCAAPIVCWPSKRKSFTASGVARGRSWPCPGPSSGCSG